MFRKQRSQRFDSESMLNLSKLWLEDIKQLGVAHNAQLLYQLLIAKIDLQRVVCVGETVKNILKWTGKEGDSDISG